MPKTYVIPDIHGMKNHLDRAIAEIEARAVGQSHKVIFLGDYIDRGPHSAQVIKAIRCGIDHGKPWVALKGNHEDFMACAIVDNDKSYGESWVFNGGYDCIQSYEGNTDQLLVDAQWAKDLPLHHKDKHRVYVHAYAPQNEPIDNASDHELMWTRYPKGADIGHMGLHVVHGHTPQKNGPELYKNRTNLDCGAVFYGRMVIGVFDDAMPGGPIEIIEVTGGA